MKNRTPKSKKGLALITVIAFTFIFTLLGFSMLHLAATEIILTQKELNSTEAFYAAEAGLAELTTRLHNKNFGNIADTALGEVQYKVDIYQNEDPPYAISTGKSGNQVISIKAELSFLATPYENAVYGGNVDAEKWTFTLRGQGNPQDVGAREVGGRDIINGNVFAGGDVTLYEESSVNPSPLPNPYNYPGDVDSTGKANVLDSATVSGTVTEGAASESHPSLADMDYAVNNTHNVSKIFSDAGVDWGHLPSDNELYNVVVKNPTDRTDECKTTIGDDYFLEPAWISNEGAGPKDARTPLHTGDNRIFYVDGDVWIHSPKTYGFLVDGTVTFVVTGDIHISDNIKYADSDSVLGLVALGRYDDSGRLLSGGNIYFGDPRYGTMYTVSALMFAADSFLYNTDSVTGDAAEPTSGFSVYGNLNALNQVSIERDWYDDEETGNARPAYFDSNLSTEGQWVDQETGVALTANEIGSIRHYQMMVTYDDRVRTQDTQPPGLPRGKGTIFGGLKYWKEIPIPVN
ncbi:MAG: hypothetical protein GY845_06420 [Planctomycetes bacterium]|nr:hypothetical protein [Planctomycetota bacterium]